MFQAAHTFIISLLFFVSQPITSTDRQTVPDSRPVTQTAAAAAIQLPDLDFHLALALAFPRCLIVQSNVEAHSLSLSLSPFFSS